MSNNIRLVFFFTFPKARDEDLDPIGSVDFWPDP